MIDPDDLAERLPDDLANIAEDEIADKHVGNALDVIDNWPCDCPPVLVATAANARYGPWLDLHRPTCPRSPDYDEEEQ